MSKAPFALITLGAFVIAAPAAVSAGDRSASLSVSVRVVSSCGVRVADSGSVDVRCARGGTDRVLVAESQPRIVVLEKDSSRMLTANVHTEQGDATPGAQFVTLQF